MRFGRSVLTLPDLDGDGYRDFAVGAPIATVSERDRGGRVFVFSGKNRRHLATWASEEGTFFGQTLRLVPDANGDGIDDVRVGFAYGGQGFEIRCARTGELVEKSAAEASNGGPGAMPERQELIAGDLNGDGVEDLVWSTPHTFGVELSATSGATLDTEFETTLWTVPWMDCGPQSGLDFDLFEDVDQDGVRDILVGTSHWATLGVPSPPAEGNVRVLSGASGESLWILNADGRSMLEQFLDETRWEKRLLLVSGPPSEVKRQMQALGKDIQGALARDIVVVDLTGETVKDRIGDLSYRPRSRLVRERFRIPEERLQVTLVGKDGTVKERYGEVTGAEDIWAVIDVMPMRRQEKRERGR